MTNLSRRLTGLSSKADKVVLTDKLFMKKPFLSLQVQEPTIDALILIAFAGVTLVAT